MSWPRCNTNLNIRCVSDFVTQLRAAASSILSFWELKNASAVAIAEAPRHFRCDQTLKMGESLDQNLSNSTTSTTLYPTQEIIKHGHPRHAEQSDFGSLRQPRPVSPALLLNPPRHGTLPELCQHQSLFCCPSPLSIHHAAKAHFPHLLLGTNHPDHPQCPHLPPRRHCLIGRPQD